MWPRQPQKWQAFISGRHLIRAWVAVVRDNGRTSITSSPKSFSMLRSHNTIKFHNILCRHSLVVSPIKCTVIGYRDFLIVSYFLSESKHITLRLCLLESARMKIYLGNFLDISGILPSIPRFSWIKNGFSKSKAFGFPSSDYLFVNARH